MNTSKNSLERPWLLYGLQRACEAVLGTEDGRWIFESLFAAMEGGAAARAA